MIPVSILTGFLGSGKTTLLARAIRHPSFARTAVVINELGEIGIDHDLVRTSEESLVALETGCLCCAVRGDLAQTLMDLVARRDAGSVMPFERVVIETSGLADPSPALQLLMTDAGLAERLMLASVVTVVDAVNGEQTLTREWESRKQLAMADRVVVSKTDLTRGLPADLAARLRTLNPAADVMEIQFGAAEPEELFSSSGPGASPVAWAALVGEETEQSTITHASDISHFVVVREAPLPAVALTLVLETLAEHLGVDLLRLKGIVNIVESPDRPVVVHGVQHVFHPLDWLDAWPSDDRRSRFVFIGRGLHKPWIEALIDGIAAEAISVQAGAGI